MDSSTAQFSISRKNVRGKLPSLPFAMMKNRILGESYLLSLVFADTSTSHELNKSYKGKDNPTDILAFPLSQNEGEIIINPQSAREKAKLFHRTYNNYIGYIFIHGLLHLNGMEHGSRMEEKERLFRKEFGFDA